MQRALDRDALIGSVIAGGFGIVWAFWAASGLPGAAAAVVRIAGEVIGAAVIGGASLRRSVVGPAASSPSSESGSMFRSRGYVVSVAIELIALVAGNAVLNATGHSKYVPVWTVLAVGVHFIGFGRLFEALFYCVGGAFILAAVVGAAVGASAGSRQAVEASTGLIAAASLFAAGALGLLSSRPPDTPPEGPRMTKRSTWR